LVAKQDVESGGARKAYGVKYDLNFLTHHLSVHMAQTIIYNVEVTFGDCDPAGIVFFPNFSKWMDASSLNFFVQNGVPTWRELVKVNGIIGTPLLEINTKFMMSATYGEKLQIHTRVVEWRDKVFIQEHIVKRYEDTLCVGLETRAFCTKHPQDPNKIKIVAVPKDIKELCQ
jgi:4-hydroxybenzoyl-CoA thioesterase